jgi:predicted Holliday junction resolvase-like endonuclease
MYSIFIITVVLVGIHYLYQYLERHTACVSNVLESQSKERYHQMMDELEEEEKPEREKEAPTEDDVKRKEELNSFLEELKQKPTSESNAPSIPQT